MSDIDHLRTTLETIADKIELNAAYLEGLERLALKLGASSVDIDSAKKWAEENPEIRSRTQQDYRYLRQQLETLCRLVFAQDQMQSQPPPSTVH